MKLGSLMASLLACWFGCGCGTTPDSGARPERESAEVLREWRKVIHVHMKEGKLARDHVGYLCRQYKLEDRAGEIYVYDLAHRAIGFVMPSGKAFVFEKDRDGKQVRREVAHLTTDLGVMRILGIEGRVEYEPVTAGEVKTSEDEAKAPAKS
jgi:hypothetical protein